MESGKVIKLTKLPQEVTEEKIFEVFKAYSPKQIKKYGDIAYVEFNDDATDVRELIEANFGREIEALSNASYEIEDYPAFILERPKLEETNIESKESTTFINIEGTNNEEPQGEKRTEKTVNQTGQKKITRKKKQQWAEQQRLKKEKQAAEADAERKIAEEKAEKERSDLAKQKHEQELEQQKRKLLEKQEQEISYLPISQPRSNIVKFDDCLSEIKKEVQKSTESWNIRPSAPRPDRSGDSMMSRYMLLAVLGVWSVFIMMQ